MITMNSTGLLLNPRLSEDVAQLQASAWQKFAKGTPEIVTASSVGISTSGSSRGAAAIGSIVVLSRAALESSAIAVNRRLRATSSDVWGLALPMFHVGGFSIPIRAALSGSRVASFTSETGEALDWSAAAFHHWLAREKVTLLSLVPTQLYDLVQAGFKSPPELRAIVVGGGRLDDILHEKARALGWPVLQSYGLTECCSQVATALPGSDGRDLVVMDHVEVRTDENQKLWLKSNALLSARITFDDERQARLEKPVSSDGWFETSDRAVIDEATKSLKILGREGETVKVLGELVDLVRVRSAVDGLSANSNFAMLSQHTWVVAIPHARREHELILIAEKKNRSSSEITGAAELLLRALRTKLAPFEVPSRIHVIEEIPRSSLGKVLSTLLTENAAKRFSQEP